MRYAAALLFAATMHAAIIYTEPVPVIGSGSAFDEFIGFPIQGGWNLTFGGASSEVSVFVQSSGNHAVGTDGRSIDLTFDFPIGLGLAIIGEHSSPFFSYGFGANGVGLLALLDIDNATLVSVPLSGLFVKTLHEHISHPGYDLFVYETKIIPAPVPEPTNWQLMLVGAALITIARVSANRRSRA